MTARRSRINYCAFRSGLSTAGHYIQIRTAFVWLRDSFPCAHFVILPENRGIFWSAAVDFAALGARIVFIGRSARAGYT